MLFITSQNWYIDDIFPLYGPVAGGTLITMTGGYFSEGNLTASLNGEAVRISSLWVFVLHCYYCMKLSSWLSRADNYLIHVSLHACIGVDLQFSCKCYNFPNSSMWKVWIELKCIFSCIFSEVTLPAWGQVSFQRMRRVMLISQCHWIPLIMVFSFKDYDLSDKYHC